jgi:hypothetical protein
MMNKEKLQQDIDAMREKLAEMEAKLQEQKKKYFIPELGKEYWSITSRGTKWFKNDGVLDDKNYIDLGNCYASEEDAEKAAAKQLAYIRIVRALRDHEEEAVDRKWIIYYESDFNNYAIDLCYRYIGTHNKELLSTLNACEWVIDNMQDDLKIYFGE